MRLDELQGSGCWLRLRERCRRTRGQQRNAGSSRPFITHRAKSGQPTGTARSTLAMDAGIERIISCKAWLDARLFLLQRYDRVPTVSGGHLPLQRPHLDKATAIKLNQQS
jgi:hypothetical protein